MLCLKLPSVLPAVPLVGLVVHAVKGQAVHRALLAVRVASLFLVPQGVLQRDAVGIVAIRQAVVAFVGLLYFSFISSHL